MATPVITIDGPAASGKSSVSRELAKKMGWSWVSTGAFYRGIAYVAQKCEVPLDNENKLVELCQSGKWKIVMDNERTQVFLQDENVTDEIYLENVGDAASKISQFPKLRAALLQAQRDCATGVNGLIAEGRDCGTVVFPNANLKIFLTAHSDSRASRRVLEHGGNVEEMKAQQSVRDAQDSSRTTAPMQVPENAHVIDTSEMSLIQVVDRVFEIANSEI